MHATSQFSRQNTPASRSSWPSELALDKGALGLLGSAFFYSYALFQMPWGSPPTVGLSLDRHAGHFPDRGGPWGFSMGHSLTALLIWR